MIPSAKVQAGVGESAPAYNRGVLPTWANRITIALSWLGVFIAGTLTIAHFGRIVPPCSSNAEGCAIVQMSKQSMFMDKVPVALLGLLAYVLLLAMAIIRVKSPDQWKTMATRGLVISGLGTGYSAYLTWVAFNEIHAHCIWCLASLATMTALFISHGLLVQAGEPGEVKPSSEWLTVGIAGVVALGAMGGTITQMKKISEIGAANLVFKNSTEAEIIGRPDQVQGNADAKVTLVEFADYNCPACRGAAEVVLKMYDGYKGKMRWAYRHFPLQGVPGHETSMLAAKIGVAAAEDGKFWKYSEIVLDKTNTEKIKSEIGLYAIAQQAGVDMTNLQKRLDGDKLQQKLADDLDVAINKLHANTTPTFVLIAEGVAPRGVGADQLEDTLKSEPYASLLK